jgi:methyl-accepting chemotaxis protein
MARFKLYTGAAFGFIVILIIIVASITYLNLQLIEDFTRHHSEESMPHELLTDVIEINLLKTQELLTDTALTGQPNGFMLAEESARLVLEGLEQSKTIARKEDETAVLQEIETIENEFRTFYTIGKTMASLYLHGETEKANKAMVDFDVLGEKLLEKYESIRDLQIHQQKADAKQILSTIHQAKILLLSTCLIAISASIIIALTILSLKPSG